MPDPDVYLADFRYEKVAAFVRDRITRMPWCDDQASRYRYVLLCVEQRLTSGRWRRWNAYRRETAVAVAQRVAMAEVYGRGGVTVI